MRSLLVFTFCYVASVSQLALAGKRWRALSCPTYCSSDVEPVCGSDGVIYKNDCDMRKRTCNQDVKSVPLEDCTQPKGSECIHKCDKEKDLVCGTDGRTYLNKCFLQVEFCEHGIEFSHYGSCVNATSTPCPKSCPRSRYSKREGPVCGSDGNVYESECDMNRRTCGQGVVSVNRRHCQTTEHCESGCWRVTKLTCGSDGKLYNNGCQMHRKNCGKHIYDVPVPFCLNKLYRTDCPLDCADKEEDKVCGSDGNIYRNLCELKKMTCGFPLTRYERIVPVDFKLCQNKENSCSRMNCPEPNEDEEVCGNDGVTYQSECLLRKATCTTGVHRSHVGPCLDLSRDEECPFSCPEVTEEELPASVVCGSDGNAYKSKCHLRLKTCGQRVTVAPNKECQLTKYCDVSCNNDEDKDAKKLVCGSDGKFYKSKCNMNKENCGRHVYVSPISHCLTRFGFQFSGCGRVCPSQYDPVCGSDGKTYSNQCFMQMENCRVGRSLKGGNVHRRYYGKCGEPKQRARYYLYR